MVGVGNAGDFVLEVSLGVLVVEVRNRLRDGVPGNVEPNLSLVLKTHSLYRSLSLLRELSKSLTTFQFTLQIKKKSHYVFL